MPTSVTTRWVVLDIEGTMTPTARVHVVLYDYARARLGEFIDEHAGDPTVQQAVREVRECAALPGSATTGEIVTVLHEWMDADRKITPLKTLQGLVWQRGFERGELEMEFFDDVLPALRRWNEAGLRLAVFSSGSVTAQRSSFSNTTGGDVRELFGAHFDTANAGPKKDSTSYRRILESLGVTVGDVVFFSDVPAELDAATKDGWRAIGFARPGEPFADSDFGDHVALTSFDEITVEAAP